MWIIWKYYEHAQSSQYPNLAALRHFSIADLEKPEVDYTWQAYGLAQLAP